MHVFRNIQTYIADILGNFGANFKKLFSKAIFSSTEERFH